MPQTETYHGGIVLRIRYIIIIIHSTKDNIICIMHGLGYVIHLLFQNTEVHEQLSASNINAMVRLQGEDVETGFSSHARKLNFFFYILCFISQTH